MPVPDLVHRSDAGTGEVGIAIAELDEPAVACCGVGCPTKHDTVVLDHIDAQDRLSPVDTHLEHGTLGRLDLAALRNVSRKEVEDNVVG